MVVFRLSREAYKDELPGYGASLSGQRWNSEGTEVVYTAQTRALANSEVAVHISLGILPGDYRSLCTVGCELDRTLAPGLRTDIDAIDHPLRKG